MLYVFMYVAETAHEDWLTRQQIKRDPESCSLLEVMFSHNGQNNRPTVMTLPA